MFLCLYFEPLLWLSNDPGFMHWQLKIFGCSHFSRGNFFGISDAVVRVRTFFRHTTFVHRFIVIFLLKRVSSCILTIKNPFPYGCSVLSLFRFDPLVFDKNSKLFKVWRETDGQGMIRHAHWNFRFRLVKNHITFRMEAKTTMTCTCKCLNFIGLSWVGTLTWAFIFNDFISQFTGDDLDQSDKLISRKSRSLTKISLLLTVSRQF